MSDETAMTDGAEGGEGSAPVEMRPCAYCGNTIHPSSHRCTHCGGHVGLAWGTVHAELFLFLFLAVLVIVGCLASWTGRTPAASAKELEKAQAKATARRDDDFKILLRDRKEGSPIPVMPEPKVMESDIEVFDTVEPAGRQITGLDSLRGTLMLAIAIYGVFIAVFNLLYRRLVMWPFVVSGMLALWTGLNGVFAATSSAAWARWGTWAEKRSLSEQLLGKIRAIPPGHLMLTIAGVVLMIKLIGGILAVATKGKPDGGGSKDAGASRRGRKGGKGDAVADAAAGTTPPATPPK
jgi:hypothetical protein